ncbi:MAG TPA: DUF1844 domain-containing protein [Acidobacteriota bacterium]
MADPNPEEPIKVTDRRLFNSEGKLRDDAPAEERPARNPKPAARSPLEAELPPDVAGFASFVLSLSTTALIHLGEIAEPGSGQREVNLEAAQHMIDILSMLRTKTRGNLSADEQKLLEAVLYDLQMKYVQARR